MGVCVGTVEVYSVPTTYFFFISFAPLSDTCWCSLAANVFNIIFFNSFCNLLCWRVHADFVRPLRFFVFLVVFIFFFRHAETHGENKREKKFVFIKKEEKSAPRVNRARARSREIVCVKRLCLLFIHSSAIGN